MSQTENEQRSSWLRREVNLDVARPERREVDTVEFTDREGVTWAAYWERDKEFGYEEIGDDFVGLMVETEALVSLEDMR